MRSPLDDAFRAVPRRDFLPPDVSGMAGLDVPLPIGFGQTNSQPTTVAMMLEWLDVQPGQKVLDVGSGSGWTTALLSYLTSPKGRVVAVEAVPELVEFGMQNAAKLGVRNAEFHKAGKAYGWPKQAPYDRILVSAAAQELPNDLTEQLATDGKLVIPVGSTILEIEKDEAGNVDTAEHPGFAFVPLV